MLNLFVIVLVNGCVLEYKDRHCNGDFVGVVDALRELGKLNYFRTDGGEMPRSGFITRKGEKLLAKINPLLYIAARQVWFEPKATAKRYALLKKQVHNREIYLPQLKLDYGIL